MQLNITARENQGVTVLDLGGRLVAGEESDTLRKKIRDLIANNQKRIIINMRDVARLDSTGIGMLVESVIYAAKERAQLKLINLPRLVHNILYTHRLLQAFEIYATEEEALASIEKSAA
jgi:anti-sigma B factor antagonist